MIDSMAKDLNLYCRCLAVINSCTNKRQLSIAWNYLQLALKSKRLSRDSFMTLQLHCFNIESRLICEEHTRKINERWKNVNEN